MLRNKRVLASAAALAPLLLVACAPKQAPVTYTKDIRPILEKNCVSCHVPGGEGYEKSGLSMATYDTLMKGTKFGPVIVPGNSASSTLLLLLEGKADPSITMPHGTSERLPEADIALFRDWIDQGAKQ